MDIDYTSELKNRLLSEFDRIDVEQYSDPRLVCIYVLEYAYKIESNTLYYDGVNIVVVVEREDATVLKLTLGKNVIGVSSIDSFLELVQKSAERNPLNIASDPWAWWVRYNKGYEV